MRYLPLFTLLALLTACSSEALYLPEGDAAAGRVVFTENQCFGCHEVRGDDFPAPTTITPTYVPLGNVGRVQSRLYLLESIVAPSHQFATPRPPAGVQATDLNIRAGQGSRMTDYSDRLTIREALDLVAYLEQLQQSGQ
jgi:hypothetical protein